MTSPAPPEFIDTFDIIVVGAGHAGCEAALATSRLGCHTLLLTLKSRQNRLATLQSRCGGTCQVTADP